MAEIVAMPAGTSTDDGPGQYQELKSEIHNKLLKRLNLDRLSQMGRREAEPEIRPVIADILEADYQTTPLSLFERDMVQNRCAHLLKTFRT